MSKHIILEDRLPGKIHLVAGIDVAYVEEQSIGAVAVLNYDSFELVESHTASRETAFPYIPTLLSFREIPPTILAIRKLQTQPDVFLVDGQGFAHPYRCGFASHLGLLIRRPTIGIAKSRLFGRVESAEDEKDVIFLKQNGLVVGAEVKTKTKCKPVYVSVGHMISLEKAVEIVKHCAHNSRIPLPILKAHEVADAEKRKINIAPENTTSQ